jgi:SWIM zinc finger
MSWTFEQILALAPDAASAKNGQGLANDRKWQNCGHTASAIWGECQGSGSKPYRAQVDLGEPAFRCSCPSRKFPCKHGLGLLLLWAQSPALFTEAASPDWVNTWLESRQQRQTKQQEKAEKAAIVDPQARAKRQEKRTQKVDAGVAELQQWLADLVRQGLATAAEMNYSQWDQLAARMVDAQAPGLARRIQVMAGIAHSGPGWPERLLAQLGELHLLLASYQRLDTLTPALRADVRSQLGWSIPQAEVLAQAERIITDQWAVLGQRDELEEQLRVRRIWLQGETSQQIALILLFAYGQQPFELTLAPGTQLSAELTFFPSAYPQRALLKSQTDQTLPMTTQPQGYPTIEALFEDYARALSQMPWLERVALSVDKVTVVQETNGRWYLCDRNHHGLPIAPSYSTILELVAIAGGHPICVMGEWNGSDFHPLSAWVNAQFVVL